MRLYSFDDFYNNKELQAFFDTHSSLREKWLKFESKTKNLSEDLILTEEENEINFVLIRLIEYTFLDFVLWDKTLDRANREYNFNQLNRGGN